MKLLEHYTKQLEQLRQQGNFRQLLPTGNKDGSLKLQASIC